MTLLNLKLKKPSNLKKTTDMRTQNKPLMTMEEKKKLNPDEIMENGLTRAQNEKIEQTGDSISGVMGIVSILLGIYAIYLVFSI